MWAPALAWFAVVQVLGLLAFPIVARACDRLPDRGWTLSKPFGLLIVAYVGWLLGNTGVLTVSRWTVLQGVLVLAILSLFAASGRRRSLIAYMRSRASVILASEALFAAAFFGMVLLRGWLSVVEHTEQPMDLMMLSSVVVSPHYPPTDAWLAGQPISYYYFGYLMVGTLALLTSIPTEIAYNLGLATAAAMAASAVFGVTFNLARLARATTIGGIAAGAVSAYFLLIASNAAGVLELAKAAGVGDAQFWGGLGLDRPNPVELQWWWWIATRAVDGAITEFPYFSFLLGDLHPHVMSIPFVLMAIGIAVQVSREQALFERRRALGRWPLALVALLSVGVLGPLNLWDIGLGVTLVAGGLFLNGATVLRRGHPPLEHLNGLPPWMRRNAWWLRAVGARVGAFAALCIVALLAYLPYYLHMDSNTHGFRLLPDMGTRPVQMLLVWGPFAVLLVPAIVLALITVRPRRLSDWIALAAGLTVAFLPIGVWLVLTWLGLPGGEGDGPIPPDANIAERSWPVVGMLALLAGLAMYGAYAATDVRNRWRSSLGPAFVVLAAASMLLLGAEFFYVDDIFTEGFRRLNTVFKLYYQAWLLLAVLSGLGAWLFVSRWNLARPAGQVGAIATSGLLILVIAATAYYPATALGSRVGEGKGLTLDGLAYLEEQAPAEAQAIEWLRENTARDAVVLEAPLTRCGLAVCSDFTPTARISAATGRPTVLGWYNHEGQWRSDRALLDERTQAIQRMYTESNLASVRDLLTQYRVSYIVYGPRERTLYSEGAMQKYRQNADLVFQASDQNGEILIFDVSSLWQDASNGT